MEFPRRPLPPMARIRRALPSEHIEDPRREVRQRLKDSGLLGGLKKGARIAITASSRGMGAFIELIGGICDAVKEAGGQPFVIPGMGSHGGGTPEGQTEIVRLLGVTEESVGAPIRATMDTIPLGEAKNGAQAHLDKIAHDADGIIVLARTTLHPESSEGLASGLLKMVVVGLGKQHGAQQAHNHGLWDSIKHVPEVTMAKAKIVAGVTVVENGYRQPLEIAVVPPKYPAFLETDQRLLKLAAKHLARLPFDKLDLLIVDEMGKTISGTGMDLNVIGKWRATGKGPREPDIKRIVALSLTKPSLGNGLGVGMADFTTRRFMEEYDAGVSYVNLLTATEPDGTTNEGPLPLALDTDREAIEVAMYSTLAKEAPRICRIESTARLDRMWISEALIEEAKVDPKVTVEEAPREMEFDNKGNLF